MTLDEKLDEILGHLLGKSSAEFMSHPKGKQIVMPAEKLYEYQVYAKKAIKELIEEEVAMDSWRVMAGGE
jgi:hypothetical protein